jgi:predicted DNA-binding protein with PD1-like motif
MQYAKLTDTTYLIRLEPGDDIVGFLGRFCHDHAITNASVTGIGSIESPTLAHYSIHTKKFQEVSFDGVFEITSLIGTVAYYEAAPAVHLHVTIADSDMHCFGGHLRQGKCSALAEISVTSYPTKFTKVQSDAVGLAVWDLPAH